MEETRNALLSQVPSVRIRRWETTRGRGPARGAAAQPDLGIDLLAGGRPWRVFVQATSSGEPRMVRAGIQSLTARVPKSGRAYGVLAAPHLGPMSQRISLEARVGFLDLAGNGRLVFGQVFIERLGSPKPAVERRALRSVCSPKAGRALRVLRAAPRRRWGPHRRLVRAGG